MTSCSVVEDYSTGKYENNYIEQKSDVAVESREENVEQKETTVQNNEKTEIKTETKTETKKENIKSDEKKLTEKVEEKKEIVEEKAEDKKEDKEDQDDKEEKKEEKSDSEENTEKTEKSEKTESAKTIDILNFEKSEPIEKSEINIEGLSNKALSWWYRPGKPVSTIDKEIAQMANKYGAIWQKQTGQNKMYLTFDEGYEHNENTTKILNTLSEKNVKAAFFITGHFLKSRPDLVQRMINEGHAVCNHSVDHMNPPNAIANNKFVAELEGLEKMYTDITGATLSPFYRPPEGGYSEAVLSAAKSLGYRTTFWSFAYKDWEVKNQPGEDAAFEKITSHFHDGSILLLHAVSDTNAKILGRVIDKAHEMGYSFGDLNELR